jgi:hypothetical protein
MPQLAAGEYAVGSVQIPSVRTPTGQAQEQTLQFDNLTYPPHRSPDGARRTNWLPQITTTIAVIEFIRLSALADNESAYVGSNRS